MMIRLILLLLALIFFSLFVFSFFQVRSHPGEEVIFIYQWAFPLGSFVWEDLLVFSLFYFFAAIITLWRQDLRIALLFFFVFWIVRSSGETLYWFLQQFNQPIEYPHNQYGDFQALRLIFGDISYQRTFILLQIFWQSVCVTTTMALILLMINWKDLNQLNKGFKES